MKIAFIYMASGFGRRFGENKLLMDFAGIPLYMQTLLPLLGVREELEKESGEMVEVEILVVSQYKEIRDTARRWGIKAVDNRESQEGITASLRLGTEEASENTDVYIYFVADQPYMKKETIKEFVRGFLKDSRGIGTVYAGGCRGNPVAFSRQYKSQLLALSGDRGGSVIVKQNLEDVWFFEVDGRELRDIDVREDVKNSVKTELMDFQTMIEKRNN